MCSAAPRDHNDHPFPHLQHYRPRMGEKLGTSGPRSRRALGMIRLTSGAGVVAEGRRDVKGVNSSVRRTGLPRRESGRLEEKEMKAVYVRCSASKKQKRAWHRLGHVAARRTADRGGNLAARSAPGPGQGGRPLHCARRALPGRLGGGSPQTLRGGRAPSLGQPRCAAELGSSPAAGSASRLRPEGQRLPTPGAAPPRPVRTPSLSPNLSIHPRPAPNSAPTAGTPAGQRESSEPVES